MLSKMKGPIFINKKTLKKVICKKNLITFQFVCVLVKQLLNHSHFLEEVPVGDDLQLLQDEEDPAADEEGLVFGQSLIQQQ